MKFEYYMSDVKSQLVENTDDEYKSEYITYHYSNKLVDENLEYFKDCMDKELSPYKALLFFGDHLKKIK